MFDYNLSKYQDLVDVISINPKHSEMLSLLKGYQLTTAEILYHMPDYPDILQTYVWQDYDLLPKLPALSNFLIFWQKELEGKLHSVRLASKELIGFQKINYASFRLDISKTIF